MKNGRPHRDSRPHVTNPQKWTFVALISWHRLVQTAPTPAWVAELRQFFSFCSRWYLRAPESLMGAPSRHSEVFLAFFPQIFLMMDRPTMALSRPLKEDRRVLAPGDRWYDVFSPALRCSVSRSSTLQTFHC